MCRWVRDTVRAEFVWELYTEGGDTVLAMNDVRNAEKRDDCIVKWSSGPDERYTEQLRSLPPGKYYWENTTTFKVIGNIHTAYATSNVFTVYPTKMEYLVPKFEPYE